MPVRTGAVVFEEVDIMVDKCLYIGNDYGLCVCLSVLEQ